MTTQRLIWLPPESNVPGTGTGGVRLACPEGRPVRLWTLFGATDEKAPPVLPFTPKHHDNAFLEDHVHDWRMEESTLRYYSRVTEGGCWLLLEYP